MQLSELLQAEYQLSARNDRIITGLSLDSRYLQSGNVFCAIKGTQSDGRHFISSAIAKGASAILVEDDVTSMQQENPVPIISIPFLPKKIGILAARFYGFPAKTMRLIGVTGTSGKTSCTHFLAQALDQLHLSCGIIGTLGNGFYGSLREVGLTTPDAITLQATLNEFAKAQTKVVAMEVSSHSIAQDRISGLNFETGIFTNLSRDHLDYHGDMATYAAVKRHFLHDMPIRQLILNADDTYGLDWICEWYKQKDIIAYGEKRPGFLSREVPFVEAHHVDFCLEGIKAGVITPWGKGNLVLPLIGDFNLGNALAVLSALCSNGVSFEQALSCLSQLKTVPGRMQRLGGKHDPMIVVDYAHKPDALQNVLLTLRRHIRGKLICIFGCGGERDRGKRPLMANIAETFADQVIITNDNPRHENPNVIVEEILSGFAYPERITVELDRSKAIYKGIQWATFADCLLIAGKGAERYQQIGDEKIPFDDAHEVKKYLQAGEV